MICVTQKSRNVKHQIYYLQKTSLILIKLSCNIWDVYHILEKTIMTTSNGNIFRVTGHLCGEFIGPRRIPRAKANDAELWCFLWSACEKNGWVNKREAGDLTRYRAHYNDIAMQRVITRPHHINITDMPKYTQSYCMAYQSYCLQSHFQVLIFVRTTRSNSVLFCCGPWYPPRSKPANHSLTSLTKVVYLPWFLVNIHHARR